MNEKPTTTDESGLQATFSTLLISLASSAMLAMGLEKDPSTGQYAKDLHLARFNIDMLKLLQAKTKGNLDKEELHFLDSVVGDLQLKFVYVQQGAPKKATT